MVLIGNNSLDLFEDYMVKQDSDDYPMHFSFRIKLYEPVLEQQLTSAVNEVARQHPRLISSIINQSGTNSWNLQNQHAIQVQNLEKGEMNSFLGQQIDLTQDNGLKVAVIPKDAPETIHFLFHHACCDGIAALSLILETIKTMFSMVDSQAEFVEQQDTCWHQLKLNQPTRTLRYKLLCARRIFRYLSRNPVYLKEKIEGEQAISNDPSAMNVERLSTSITLGNHLRKQFTEFSPSVTWNDILLSVLFHTLSKTEILSKDLRRWVRIAVPVNMREASSPPDIWSYGNDVSMVFLDRKAEHCRDMTQLTPGISREMHQVKRYHGGDALFAAISMMHYIPGLLDYVTKGDRSATTAVLSNLGKMAGVCDEIPNMSYEDICDRIAGVEFYPPIRSGTAISLGAVTYNDRLALSLSYDQSRINSATASEILQNIKNALEA